MAQKALILGSGRSGKAAERLLVRFGFAVTVLDGEDVFPAAGDFSVAIVSPGLALSHPWIVAAQRRGIPLKSELQVGCEALKQKGVKLLAVTGSKGKSSIVKLVAEAVGGIPCGNYGRPVCDVACEENLPAWAVVEVSSFMLETTTLPATTFEGAAILNLQEDHLDRHGSVETYHALKRRLLQMTPHPFEGADVSVSSALWEGSYFDNTVLSGNATGAVKLMRVAGLTDAQMKVAFKQFRPLPHRMNLIAEMKDIRYIDDSKATSLAALEAGVLMATSLSPHPSSPIPHPSLLLIAGGLPKGDDPRTILPTLTESVKKVYLIGQSAEAFCTAWKGAVDCEICETLIRAVGCVKREAEPGEIVLLSPGAASYDQFRSFEERGDVFARLVKEKENDK